MLERSEWYDIARKTNWTPKYVTEEQLFPPEMSDPYGVSNELWETYDEPYKVSYTEYVSVRREKDLGTYSDREVMTRWIDIWVPIAERAIDAYCNVLPDNPDASAKAKRATAEYRAQLGL